MKNYKIVLILVLIFASFSASASDTLFVSSKIKKATIFSEGARLSRTGKLKVKKGVNIVVFKDVTDMFSNKGIQVKSNRNITLLGIMTRKNFSENKETNKKMLSISLKQRKLRKSIKKLQTELQVYSDEESMILANQSVISSQKDLAIEEITKIAIFYRKRLSEIKSKKLKITRLITTHNNKITNINRQLNELNARRKIVTNEVIVSLSSAITQNINLTVVYFTKNAGWTPIYDIRVDDISKPVKLSYKAEVFQNTGNDWKNIKIKLSTNNPSKSNTQPVIKPWTLHFINYDNSSSKDGKNKSRTSHVFAVKNKHSIPSDGKNHSIIIKKHSLNAEYEYFAVPKLDKKVYLTARISDWEKYNLLNGKSNLFFKGTFIGDAVLDLNTASDTIDISLGEDKNIVIERENMKSYNKRQAIGNKQTEERVFEITVRNNKNRKIRIRIEDQIPVSKNDDIYVKLISAEKGKVTEVDGKITWILEQKPNTSTKLKFHYSVKYPKRESVKLE